jgi:hypothetical protein
MTRLYRRKRGREFSCLRFFVLVLLCVCVLPAFAQKTDSLYYYKASVATEYFDLFRQKSERTSTTIFAKHTSLSLSVAHTSDTLCLFADEEKEYGAYDNHFSKFSITGENSVQSGGVSWNSGIAFLEYSLTAGIQLNGARYSPFGGVEVQIKPFADFLTASFAWSRAPIRGLNSFLFQDFAVHLADDAPADSWNFTVAGKPFEDAGAGIRLYESRSDHAHASMGYAPDYSFYEFGRELFFTFAPMDSWTAWGRLFVSQQRGSLFLFSEDQSFENLPNATGEQTGLDGRINTTLFTLPFTASYSYRKISSDGVGEVESWPFTSLASSVISNRLNYHFNAAVTIHSLSLTQRMFVLPAIDVQAEYLFVIPDAYAEHWQPQFLVFGVKDYVKDYFSIEKMHLLKIAALGNFRISKMDVRISLEQYLPVSIIYRAVPSVIQPPAPSPQPPSPKPSTDGGRRATIALSFNF